MEYEVTVGELEIEFPELAGQVRGFDSVMQVVDWVQQNLGKVLIDFVSHDEFSYDLLIQWQDRWLTFGVN
jgi:hypothetical protein